MTIWGDYGRVEGTKVFMGVAQILLDNLDLSHIVIGWYKLFGTSSLVSVPPGGGKESFRDAIKSTDKVAPESMEDEKPKHWPLVPVGHTLIILHISIAFLDKFKIPFTPVSTMTRVHAKHPFKSNPRATYWGPGAIVTFHRNIFYHISTSKIITFEIQPLKIYELVCPGSAFEPDSNLIGGSWAHCLPCSLFLQINIYYITSSDKSFIAVTSHGL